LKDLVFAVRDLQAQDANNQLIIKQALSDYLFKTKKWSERDAALMAHYAGLNIDDPKAGRIHPPDRTTGAAWLLSLDASKLINANLGPLAAIGEQKATQLFAQLAGCFDADATSSYEAIFTAWGGDVQERSLDMTTGKVRPREITVDEKTLKEGAYRHGGDPAVYARVDYLDENANISEVDKDACRTILKNLPVVFTFAPMNILYYQVTFQPNTTHDLTVSYSQYAYKDTHDPASYQMAYVVHPASFWQEFGPIHLKVTVPEGIQIRGCRKVELDDAVVTSETRIGKVDTYIGSINSKTGEIYLALNADAWQLMVEKTAPQAPAPRQAAWGISKGQ
jgi:hypothetical protein